MRRVRVILATLLWSLLPGLSWAEVRVHLQPGPLSLSQPFELTIESTGASAGPPDLTPLQQDFQILNRGLSTQTSVINGVRTQRTSLSLSLLPKRSGNLTLPALGIGGEYSQPQPIRVSPGPEPAQTASPPTTGSSLANPWEMPGMQAPSFGLPQPSPPVPYSGLGSFPGQGLPSYAGQTVPPAPVPVVPPTQSRINPPSRASQPEQTIQGNGYPDWLVAVLVMGWMATLAFCWRRRGSAPSPGKASPAVSSPVATAPIPPPETELEQAVRAVRLAYERGEAKPAREALLHWARLNWVDQAPVNLTQLAGRFEGALNTGLLALDAALYSPTPLPWNQVNLADLLPPAKAQPDRHQGAR